MLIFSVFPVINNELLGYRSEYAKDSLAYSVQYSFKFFADIFMRFCSACSCGLQV